MCVLQCSEGSVVLASSWGVLFCVLCLLFVVTLAQVCACMCAHCTASVPKVTTEFV